MMRRIRGEMKTMRARCIPWLVTAALVSPVNAAVMVHLRLVDADTGKTLPGMVRLRKTATDQAVAVPGLLKRVSTWYSLPEPTAVLIASGKYVIEAVAGLETETGRIEIDAPNGIVTATIPLKRFAALRDEKRYGGNTHLHLQRMTRAQADRYLHQHPTADGLDLLFISHLKRADADPYYITNEYDLGPQPGLSTDAVIVSNGEEHRHNFGPGGEGFGHVMLLDIDRMVSPVSIGPGIMKVGTDSQPIQIGIDDARRQGGTAIWCHNDFGFEDVPNLVTGRLDAVNIFDGGARGTYADTFYVYLNAGFRVPFSTGTDWGLYDYSRVYAAVDDPIGIKPWLDALARGRTFITNGPLLWLQVNGRGPGRTVNLPAGGGEITADARCLSRHNFGRLELVVNGEVVHEQTSTRAAGHYQANFRKSLRFTEPGWVALRTTGGGANEFGKDLFSHASAVYVDLNNRRIRRPQAVAVLKARIAQGRQAILEKGKFDDDEEKNKTLRVYDQAAAALAARDRTQK